MGYLHTLPPVKTHIAAVAYSGLIIAAIYMLSFFRVAVPLAAAISQLLYITVDDEGGGDSESQTVDGNDFPAV